MTWSDHSHRAAAALLVVVCLVLVPAVAQAAFSSRQAPGLSAGTAQLVTPSGITGSYTCTRSGSNASISVTVRSFTDAGLNGSTYRFTLAQAGVVRTTTSSTSKTQTLTAARGNDDARTTWTISVRTVLNLWTSGTGTANMACPNGNGTQTFEL